MAVNRLITSFVLLLCSTFVYAAPAIQHWTTDNGARVYFVPAPELPMVDIQVVFDAGAAHEGDKAGLAAMTSAMMDEGAAGMSTDEIAEAIEGVGAGMGFSSHQDMAVGSLRTVTDEKLYNRAIEIFTQVLTQPDFPEADFERIRKQMLIGVQAKKQQPGAIAHDAFMAALYGDHPYAHPASGTEESLNALSRDEAINYYKQFYVGNNAVVAIVGDLDRAGAEQLVNQVIGKLPAGSKPAPLAKVSPLAEAVTNKINHPSSQSHILMGQPGMKRGDADYFTLYVGNHILGGSGLTSRIIDEIREKRGLSYSAYSYFSPMRDLGPYTLGLQTKNESADEALKVLKQTLVEFINNGPSEKELTASKQNITGGFPLRLSSNQKIVEYIAMIGFYDLPLDYLDTFNSKVEAVTVDSIKEAFQRRINPEKMVTVIVGGAE